ncbi:MAG: hypothetical protein QF733_05335 [Phycisphaerales bacterium]|nr:hypothetical protein [Phycisphaerales bacterium]
MTPSLEGGSYGCGVTNLAAMHMVEMKFEVGCDDRRDLDPERGRGSANKNVLRSRIGQHAFV